MTYLFFTDDTLLFSEASKTALHNIRCILLSFYSVPGLNINLAKSELVDKSDASSLSTILGCKCLNLPIKYLGLLLGAKRIRKS